MRKFAYMLVSWFYSTDNGGIRHDTRTAFVYEVPCMTRALEGEKRREEDSDCSTKKPGIDRMCLWAAFGTAQGHRTFLDPKHTKK